MKPARCSTSSRSIWQPQEAKALTKRTAVSAAVVLVVVLLFRALVPWVLLGLAGWWIWKALSK